MTVNTDAARDVQGLRGGIIVPVPEGEAIVRAWRERYDSVAALGVPAHITLLYPFLAADEVDADGRAFLTELFARTPAVRATLARVGRFPEVVYLAPEPAAWFSDLTEILSRRFGLLPYGGAYDSVVPHLTVAQHADSAVLDEVTEQVAPRLPIEISVGEVWLMEQRAEGHWQHRATFPLAPSP
jgi:2'-5' RNA ligase